MLANIPILFAPKEAQELLAIAKREKCEIKLHTMIRITF